MAAFTEEQVKDFSIKNWYDLSGQVAVVTGGATGLGLAITRCLVSAGAKVAVVASRAPELVADTLAECTISSISPIPTTLRNWPIRSPLSRAP
jgi:NAD(P)-dependent dehydrogenase (short-subunit alcohol dehydrogenase family)